MSFDGKRVLITGAGGFIGSHLAERMVDEGAEVRALVHYNSLGTAEWLDTSPRRDDMEIVLGDICDRDQMQTVTDGVDVVFHLAALIAIPYSYVAPNSYLRTNIEGTMNVLQAVRAHDRAVLVHTSTSEVYGTAQSVPIDETHPLQGQSPYSASKIAADKMVEAFHSSFDLPVVTVRPFNTFGPRQSARAIIPTLISQGLRGEKFQLGNLHPTRDFTFVSDTVSGFVAAVQSSKAVGETINLGTGREIAIGDLAKMVADGIGKEIEIVTEAQRLRPEASEVDRLLSNPEKAKALMGWSAEVSLEDGIAKTIAWIGDNLDRYRKGYVI